jgi:YVTN family beta-propeller protein
MILSGKTFPKFSTPNKITLKFWILCFCLTVMIGQLTAADYRSPINVAVGNDGSTIYVAESTFKSLAVLSTIDNSMKKRIMLPEAALAIASAQNDDIIYMTTNTVEGKLLFINVARDKVVKKVDVGHTPTALAVGPDNRLYVCNRFDNNVSVIDLEKQKKIIDIPVSREPVAIAVTLDGKNIFIANHLPAGSATDQYVGASIEVISGDQHTVIASIPLPNGSSSVRDMCLSPDGKFIYVTHILGRYLVPTTQLERGWMNTNALSIIDVAAQKWLNTVLLDDVDRGAANPWGVRCTEDGASLCVSLSGTHEIMVIDRLGMHDKLDKLNHGEVVSRTSRVPEDVQNDLSFLVGLKRRLPLNGNSPRGFAIVGSKIYVAQYFSDSVGFIDIDHKGRPRPGSIVLAPPQEIDAVRRGEIMFSDASLCFQQWQSCVSCHPDTRADGFNWDLLNDGIGNPKQVKSLVLSHKTPPAMISGIRPRAEVAVRAGIKYIQFAVRPEKDAEDIDEYLKSLQPIPSPHLKDGSLNRSAKRGKKMFEKAGCASCHSGEYYTDMKKYDLGMGTFKDTGVEFDVPTLREIWRTSPYLYDGRAATIMDVLTRHNQGDKHGVTSQLSEKELNDLAEFVLSL